MDKNKDLFSADQSESLIQMMIDVVSADGEPTAKQREYFEKARALFRLAEKSEGTWA